MDEEEEAVMDDQKKKGQRRTRGRGHVSICIEVVLTINL